MHHCSRRFAILVAAVVLPAAPFGRQFAVAQEVGCDLQCQNNGICTHGPADFHMHHGRDLAWPDLTESPNGYHCECTDNWTGLTCDIHYRKCSDEAQHICYHGSQCVEDQYLKDGRKKFACDCSTIDDNVHYVGPHCGNRQTSPDCAESTPQVEGDSWFCVNGGTCGDPHEPKIDKKCNCGQDFAGPHCEFPVLEEPVCSLRCSNGGQCRFGIKDMTMYEPVDVFFVRENHFDFMHCVCPEGFTGITCEIPVEPCLDGFCFFGATCRRRRRQGEAGFCDCLTATSARDDLVYGGKSCEYVERKAVDDCPSLNEQDSVHCFNGGVCRSDGGCDCVDGFEGPQCEYTHDTSPLCNLACCNGGTCRVGVKDYGSFHLLSDLPFLSQTEDEFQYCSCPLGFTGLQCEIPVATCSTEDNFVCFHGGSCQEQGDGSWTCDCSTTTALGTAAAGTFCQHVATQYCSTSDNDSDQFCTNGGTCLEIVQEGGPHPGCLCKAEYVGNHCEIPKGGGCVDQADVKVTVFQKVKGLKVTCAGIAASRDKDLYCGAFSKWRRSCRVTCNTCRKKDDPCQDDESKAFAAYRSRRKDCAWLAQLSTRKRNKVCQLSLEALEKCPQTCNVCSS